MTLTARVDGKNITGVGETQDRVEKAVQRSVPFTFMAQTITVLWAPPTPSPRRKSPNAAETPGLGVDRPEARTI